MNKAILYPEVQKYIRDHQKSDITRLVLKGSPFSQISAQELAMQISGLKTAQKKIPTWFSSKNILYPPKLNLEQSSSEITAKYKASIVKGKEMIDITGGFGIDAYFFAKNFENFTYCELDPELSEIVRYNFQALGTKNIEVISGDGMDYLKRTNKYFNWIYLDPARRNEHGGKVFKLADCLPDVPASLNMLFDNSDNILVKTSPLLDLKAGITELRQVSEIHIVSVKNEVKELLWILKKKPSERILIKTLNFQKNNIQEFDAFYDAPHESNFSLPKKYLYEPNPAIMKSALFDALSIKTGTFKLHPNSHLFTSENLLEFPGRIFHVTDIKYFNLKNLKKKLKLKKANITTRNFPDSVEKIRNKLKIKDGGDTYLFFTTNLQEEKIVLICEKIK